MTIADAIRKVVERHDLTVGEAESVLDQIMSGDASDIQIAALLTALRMKGEKVEELTGFARVMRRRASPIRAARAELAGTGRDALIDTCGTGGDVTGTFNISTATALVVSGAGLPVAKHGNRSVSSLCGSADVVEALGVRIDLTPEQIGACIDQVGIGFLHAPLLHGAMKHVAAARKQMGIRTIFNMLGPLTNPAGAANQLIGVYSADLTETLAGVLRSLGSEHVLVVHGSDGMDEITISGESRVTELRNGEVGTYSIRPEQFGIPRASLNEIQGGDARQNASIIMRILDGEKGARRDVVLLNAAAALVAGNAATDFGHGIDLARDSLDSGRALDKLNRLVELTTSF